MMFYGYSFYNRKVSCYTAPHFEQYDKELKVEMMKRAYILAKDADREQLEECDFYYVGSFDDKTGSFNLSDKPEFLLSFKAKDDGK